MDQYVMIAIAGIVGILFGWLGNRLLMAPHTRAMADTKMALDQQTMVFNKLQEDHRVLSVEHESLKRSSIEYKNLAAQKYDALTAELEQLKIQASETETLLQAGQPVIHSLKLKLIEANNTISRYKAKLGANT